jgi:putative Mg2+ transporter-C (MgtC) family protein
MHCCSVLIAFRSQLLVHSFHDGAQALNRYVCTGLSRSCSVPWRVFGRLLQQAAFSVLFLCSPFLIAMTFWEFVLRLGCAFFLGAAVGFERQWRQRSAGLRTNTLVSLGSASYILLSLVLTDGKGDPSRVAGQVVTGIGFLGAGVIMKDGLTIKGLNTAATIWCSAAIGCTAGAGLYAHSAVITALVMLTHLLLRPIGQRISRRPLEDSHSEGDYLYTLTVKAKPAIENHVRVLLMQFFNDHSSVILRSLRSADSDDPNAVIITASLVASGNNDHILEKLAGRLTIEQDIVEVTWNVSSSEENDL